MAGLWEDMNLGNLMLEPDNKLFLKERSRECVLGRDIALYFEEWMMDADFVLYAIHMEALLTWPMAGIWIN